VSPSPPTAGSASRSAVAAATLACGVLIAFQMAGKATRDALFLSTFDVAALPAMVIASALGALALALAAARVLPQVTPQRLVPLALLGSALLLVAEWWLIGGAAHRAVVVMVYLHYGGLGALLISGFWSLVSERFDPRTAKRHIGRIAAGGTVGGLVGGVVAERAAVWLSVPTMLLVLAGLQVAAAVLVRRMRTESAPVSALPPPPGFGIRTIGTTPYLRGLVVVVLLAALAEGLIDFVFKARAAQTLGRGEELLRLFAVFYTGVGLLTAMLQAVAARPALERLGLAPTVALMPGAVAAGSAAVMAVPGLAGAAALRGIETVLRNSLYRAGYELLFTPLAAAEKRATKTLIDVGAVRVGDIAGGGLVQLLLLVGGVHVEPLLLAASTALSVAAVAAALRLRAGYLSALERSLVAQAVRLDPADVHDLTTRTALRRSAVTMALSRPTAPSPPVAAAPPPVRRDPLAERVARLRDPASDVVRAALTAAPLTPTLAGHVIPLLARDDLARDVAAALRPVAATISGQLIDHLLDPGQDFAVRRRIPMLLAGVPSERTADGLLRGLADSRFEVRYRCGRALLRLSERDPRLAIPAERVQQAVLAEVAVDRTLWESRRLLDAVEEEDSPSPLVDELLRKRADRSLEHVFTLLALMLPRQPLTIAFRGLHTTDPMLRGTALEYLETALPEPIRVGLWPFLEDRRAPRTAARPPAEVLAALVRSQQSITVNLEALRRPSAGR